MAHVPKKRRTEPVRTNGDKAHDTSYVSPTLRPRPSLEILPPPPQGEFLVMKFGGSSVGQQKRLPSVIELIKSTKADPGTPPRLAVVVSAMGDTTDWLLDAADYAAKGDKEAAEMLVDRIADLVTTNAITTSAMAAAAGRTPDFVRLVREFLAPLRQILLGMSIVHEKTPQVQDYVLSFGERLSAFIITQILNAQGTAAVFVDARTWVRTDDCFGMAQIDLSATRENAATLSHEWPADAVAVHTGFVGSTADGRTTTIGRNGSDYTATLLGAALLASRVIINTDVDGVYTADPRIVSSAYPVQKMSYYEAIQLSMYGTSLFHPRTFLPLIETGVPMLIRNTLRPECGTLIASSAAPGAQGSKPMCITSLERLCMIELVGRGSTDQIAQRAQRVLDGLGATVHLSSQASQGQVHAYVLHQSWRDPVMAGLSAEFSEQVCRGEMDPVLCSVEEATLVSIVMDGLRSSLSRVTSTCTSALADMGVGLLHLGQGPRTLSCLVSQDHSTAAVSALHTAFNLSSQVSLLLLLGQGCCGFHQVAPFVLALLQEQAPQLRKELDLSVTVVGVCGPAGSEFQEAGLSMQQCTKLCSLNDAAQGMQHAPEAIPLDLLARQPNPVLVDCSDGSSGHSEHTYAAAIAKGISVVASSARSLQELSSSFVTQHVSKASSHFACTSTVGGAVPVIPTLRSALRTGDKVLTIECALSGSMNYVTNMLAEGASLVEAMRAAISNRYTERWPAEDWGGKDMARRMAVLAQQLGRKVDEFQVSPLLPGAELPSTDQQEAVLAALGEHQEAFEAWQREHPGERLRYVGVLTADEGKVRCEVSPRWVGSNSEMFTMRGTELYVAFKTERMQRVLMQAAGMGGASGAVAVVNDILALATKFNKSKPAL